MASPIKNHRPKCALRDVPFARVGPYAAACTCFEMPNNEGHPEIMNGTSFYRGVMVFIVEWREYHNNGDYYVYAWTTAPDRAWWPSHLHPDREFWIANTATQVRNHVRNNPHRYPKRNKEGNVPSPDRLCRCGSTEHWTSQHTNQEGNTMNTPPATPTTTPAAALRRQAEQILIEADRLDRLAKEPRSGIRYAKGNKAKGQPPVHIDVVWWCMTFEPGTRRYHYAAVRTHAGLWSTTGPRSPKDYTWDQLINWIDTNSGGKAEVYLGTAWEALTRD